MKYRGLPRIARDLAAATARHLSPPAAGSVLVPVPLGPKRLAERGYNQSEFLARALAERWQLRIAPHLLKRARETATQTTLTPTARLANVAGAFSLGTPGFGSEVSPLGPALVLVDDVFTTGATLAEAARALEQGGALHITAVTFGRAVIPDFTQERA